MELKPWTSMSIMESSWGKPFVFNGLECSIEVFDVSGEEEMERVEGACSIPICHVSH